MLRGLGLRVRGEVAEAAGMYVNLYEVKGRLGLMAWARTDMRVNLQKQNMPCRTYPDSSDWLRLARKLPRTSSSCFLEANRA